MATDMFMIYQINDAEKNREYRCRSYAYQIEHGFMITTDNYEISYCAKASQGLFPAKIRANMESLNSKSENLVSVTLSQSQRQERPHFTMWTKKHW